MSQENVELVVGYFKAADLAAGADVLAEDVTFSFHGDSGPFAGAETMVGKEAGVAWMKDWFSRFTDFQFEVDEVLDLGDRVLAVTTHRGKGRASGVPVEMQTAQVLTVRDGKIVRQENFPSRAEALEAVGLSEQDAHAGS